MILRGALALMLAVCVLLGAIESVRSECRVNARLDCSDEFGRDERAVPAWAPRSVALRAALLNSDDVQNSSSGCLLFTTLLRYECSLNKPLQAVYYSSVTGPSEIFSKGEAAELLDHLNTLPPAFQRYFSADAITDARMGAITTLIRLGDATSRALQSFLSLSDNKTALTIPARCLPDSSFEVCGVTATCVARKDPRVGDAIKLTKIGALGLRSSSAFCSEAETLRQVLTALETMHQNSVWDAWAKLQFEAPQTPKFSSFSRMPLLNQVDGWTKGLSMDKYGDESGRKVVAPGICMPTANSMMALALKQELPGSRLGNRFDSVGPAGVANVRAVNTEPTSKSQLQYDHYATHIHEMLRAGGLRWRYPTKFSDYKSFFHRNPKLSDPLVPSLSDRKPIEGTMGINRTFAFFDRDYPNALPVQRYVEQNYKSWISKRTAFTLGLQSSASQPPNGSTEVVGHAIAAQGYSGSSLIAKDPWKVTSTLKFSDYRYPDAGKILASVDDPSFPDCIASIPQRCESAAQSCLTMINRVINTSGGKVNISLGFGCSYSGGTVPSYSSLFERCKKEWKCQKTINLQRPNGTYRMLTNVGATPGYVGSKSAEGFRTAAYVTSYMTADPWPVVLTKDEFRAKYSSTDLETSQSSPADCTALTQGEVVVEGQRYLFRNPVPLAKGQVTQTNSTQPITVGCVNLHRIGVDGAPAPEASNLFGTMAVTCSENRVTVTSNQCQALPTKKPCSVAHGSGYQYPVSKAVGLSFLYDGYGECVADRCRVGFTLNPLSKACECVFTDVITYERRAGSISAAGECVYDTSVCPEGMVKNASSDEFYPSCVSTSKDIDIQSPLFRIKGEFYRDAKNRRLADFADPNSVYRFNAKGEVEWQRCRSPRRMPTTADNGDTVCVARPEYTAAVDLTLRLSSGRKADGTCAEGFLLDYDRRFCVAKLTSCDLSNGGWGMVTYDPEAPHRCRFMGCLDGSTPIAFDGQEDGVKDRAYFCGSDPSLRVVSDNAGGERLVQTFESGAQVDFYRPRREPPLTKAMLLDDLSLRNVSTDLDCSRERDPSARGVCRLLAQGNVDAASRSSTGASAEAINSWRMSTSVPLTTFNCGGPDSVELPYNECLENWSEKRKTLGDCVVPNGKGVFVMGQGCLVDSCLPGFSPNPSKRACLDLQRGCYRRDFPAAEAYLAQLPEAAGWGARCLLSSCPTGFTFFDEFATFKRTYDTSSPGIVFERSYADYCLPTTSQNPSIPTRERFEHLRSAGFPGFSARPGTTCGRQGGVDEGVVNPQGACIPMRCESNHAIDQTGVCAWYRQDDHWRGPQYSKHVLSATYGTGMGNLRDMVLKTPSTNTTTAGICLWDSSPSSFSGTLKAIGFTETAAPQEGRVYFSTQENRCNVALSAPLSSNDLVVEAYDPTSLVYPRGLGRVRFSGGAAFAELETCLIHGTHVARDRRRCILPPHYASDPRAMRGGYVLRSSADPFDVAGAFALVDLSTGNTVGATSGEAERISAYASQTLRADLAYNLSMGPAPLPLSAPPSLCSSDTHFDGNSCVDNVRSCGFIANGNHSQRWANGKFGACSISCSYNYHLEQGECVSNTRSCTTPSGQTGTQTYAYWMREWNPCKGPQPEPTAVAKPTPSPVPTFNIYSVTPRQNP